MYKKSDEENLIASILRPLGSAIKGGGEYMVTPEFLAFGDWGVSHSGFLL